jgi:hypothetical protein
MPEEKPVVDLATELLNGAGDKPASEIREKKILYRFKKIDCPAQKVRIEGGQPIEFRLVRRSNGGFESYSVFDTTDAALADKLKKTVQQGVYMLPPASV